MREAPPTKTCLQYLHSTLQGTIVLVRLVFQLNDPDKIPLLPLFSRHFEYIYMYMYERIGVVIGSWGGQLGTHRPPSYPPNFNLVILPP